VRLSNRLSSLFLVSFKLILTRFEHNMVEMRVHFGFAPEDFKSSGKLNRRFALSTAGSLPREGNAVMIDLRTTD
jgi:hypothetical protein